MLSTVDVGHPQAVEGLVDTAVATHGGLDVFFGNAGIIDFGVESHDISHELWERVIRVNLGGSFYGGRAATVATFCQMADVLFSTQRLGPTRRGSISARSTAANQNG